ncbi:EVI5-like protein [Symsagittifera roscoffensis]|uniref:EVI5-like protein n=1 Tax=Symsagittifera roscoffensis TaxID=84072 RepID=UPI00307C269F
MAATKQFFNKIMDSDVVKTVRKKSQGNQSQISDTSETYSVIATEITKSPEEKIIELYDTFLEQAPENPQKLKAKFDDFGFIVFGRASTTSSDSGDFKDKDQKRYKKMSAKLSKIKNKSPDSRLSMSEKIRSSKKFKKWSYKGFPLDLRDEIYSSLASSYCTNESSDVYETMVSFGRKNSTFIRQIDADIHRTLRKHSFYSERYSTKQKHLFNILVAYSVFNPQIGYCQGLNLIAAILLIYIKNEPKTFWALHWILVDPLNSHFGFMCPGFPKYQCFEDHFRNILRLQLNDVYENFELQNIPYSAFLPKWFFLLFLEALPFAESIRVFDIFMFRGQIALIPFAITIMQYYRKHLAKLSMENVITFILDAVPSDIYVERDKLFSDFKKIFKKFKKLGLCLPPAVERHNVDIDYEFGRDALREIECEKESRSLEKEIVGSSNELLIVTEVPVIEIDSLEESDAKSEQKPEWQKFPEAPEKGSSCHLEEDRESAISGTSSAVSVTSEKTNISEKIAQKMPELIKFKDAKQSLQTGFKRTFEKPAGLSKILTHAFATSRPKEIESRVYYNESKLQDSKSISNQSIDVRHHYPSRSDSREDSVDLFDSVNKMLLHEIQAAGLKKRGAKSNLNVRKLSNSSSHKSLETPSSGFQRSMSDAVLKMTETEIIIQFIEHENKNNSDQHLASPLRCSEENAPSEQIFAEKNDKKEVLLKKESFNDAVITLVKNQSPKEVKFKSILNDCSPNVKKLSLLRSFQATKDHFMNYSEDVCSVRKFKIPQTLSPHSNEMVKKIISKTISNGQNAKKIEAGFDNPKMADNALPVLNDENYVREKLVNSSNSNQFNEATANVSYAPVETDEEEPAFAGVFQGEQISHITQDVEIEHTVKKVVISKDDLVDGETSDLIAEKTSISKVIPNTDTHIESQRTKNCENEHETKIVRPKADDTVDINSCSDGSDQTKLEK